MTVVINFIGDDCMPILIRPKMPGGLLQYLNREDVLDVQISYCALEITRNKSQRIQHLQALAAFTLMYVVSSIASAFTDSNWPVITKGGAILGALMIGYSYCSKQLNSIAQMYITEQNFFRQLKQDPTNSKALSDLAQTNIRLKDLPAFQGAMTQTLLNYDAQSANQQEQLEAVKEFLRHSSLTQEALFRWQLSSSENSESTLAKELNNQFDEIENHLTNPEPTIQENIRASRNLLNKQLRGDYNTTSQTGRFFEQEVGSSPQTPLSQRGFSYR